MNKTTLLYSTLLGTLIIVAYTLFLENSEKTKDQISASNSDYNQALLNSQKTSLEQQVKSLQGEVESIHVTLKLLTTKLNSTRSSVSVIETISENSQPSKIDLEDIQATEEKIKETGEERFKEQFITIEDSFTNESVNEHWAEEKIDFVLSAFNSLPSEIQESIELKNTDCKSSMCRIEVQYDDNMVQNEFEQQLPMLVGEDFPTLSIRHEQKDGITKGIYFLQSENI